jgi:hypothetical protein
MNRVLCTILLVFGVATLLVGLQTAVALPAMDSGSFSWQYEMSDDPVSQDLDSRVGPDWAVEAGDYSISGGKLSYATTGGYNAIRSDPGGSGNVWNNITVDTGFTLEASVKAAPGSSISSGAPADGVVNIWGDVAPSSGGTKATANLLVGATSVSWDLYAGGWSSLQSWTGLDNSSAFHTYRIAQLPGQASFSLWRDGVLLGSGLATGYNTIYANLSVNQRGNPAGDASQIDYIRLTSGAYEPAGVPEPGTSVLLGMGVFGLLAYAWRKRK